MVTTLYLLATTAEEPKPNAKQSPTSISQWISSTLGGGQDGASAIYPLDMKTAKGAGTNQITQTPSELGATHYVWFKAWISPKLSGDQTISGTLTIVLDTNEGGSAHNMMPRIRVYVWKADDTGVRGTLYSDTDSATESDYSDGTKQTFFDAVALSNVNALDGDRIVIEIMTYDNNTKTLAYVHRINFADSGTASDSYIEFSQDITFQGVAQTYTKTWATDVLFKKLGLTKTAVVDAAFKKRDIQIQKQVDALFKKLGILKTFGVDVDFLKLDVIKSFAIDARFGAIVTYIISRQIDALFKRVGLTKTTTVDVLFKKLGITKSFGIDAWFGAVGAVPYTKAFALDVIFAYKVEFPELWLSEDGKILINIDRPYSWVGEK